jgi:hypothetical protein
VLAQECGRIKRAEVIQRHVQPTPGTLVLFPSYFWHGTIPFNTTDERITVAFDVVPRA